MSEEKNPAVITENFSCMIKTGIAGDVINIYFYN